MATITIQLLRLVARMMVFCCFQEDTQWCLDLTNCFPLFISRRNWDALSNIPRNSKGGGGGRYLEKNESVFNLGAALMVLTSFICLLLLTMYESTELPMEISCTSSSNFLGNDFSYSRCSPSSKAWRVELEA